MATSKKPPTKELVKRSTRVPKAQERHLLIFKGGKKLEDSARAEESSACTCENCNNKRATSALVPQEEMERYFFTIRQLNCVEKRIALALSNGAKNEWGVHTADLVPVMGGDYHIHLKLVIR